MKELVSSSGGVWIGMGVTCDNSTEKIVNVSLTFLNTVV
jgi:hypothetical protein